MAATLLSDPPAATLSPAPGRHVDASTVRRWLQDGSEIALLDVREHGQYGEGHPFFAVHLPYSRLELEAPRLVPRKSTRIVVFDDGPQAGVARQAQLRLQAQGYTGVHVLEGGAPGWQGTGAALFKGVNLPSKTFGEQVEHVFHVPHISAAELKRRLDAGEPLVLLDGRTLEEHRKMTIPGAIPVPNGELALRWRSVVPDATTPIVVHCAGRTRSIIGAQILRDLGVPNPIVALENGTQGWALAGYTLEHGSTRSLPPATPGQLAASAEAAPVLPVAEAQGWLDDPQRNTFVLDVRTADEFAAGSLPGARHAPGGQLLQAADLVIGVRGARALLLDDDGQRAPAMALWLRRLGFEAAVVQGGLAAPLRATVPAAPILPSLPEWGAEQLAGLRNSDNTPAPTLVVDLRGSLAYRRQHSRGALWSIRPTIARDVERATDGDQDHAVLLLADEEAVARLAAQDLRDVSWQQLAWAPVAAARAAGWPQESTPQLPADADAIDFLFFVHDRHDGNLEAARRYLEWETGLIAQCTADELGSFRLPA